MLLLLLLVHEYHLFFCETSISSSLKINSISTCITKILEIIISMMISVIIFLEYYFGYHATFGLLVVSMIIFMMLVDVLLLGVLFSEMMFTCGS